MFIRYGLLMFSIFTFVAVSHSASAGGMDPDRPGLSFSSDANDAYIKALEFCLSTGASYQVQWAGKKGNF